jgi:hypothetical protein
VHVTEPRAIVDTVASHRISTSDELVEECVALLAAIRDGCERRVLARDADAGMAHDQFQEPGLPLAEAEIGDES